MATVRPKLFEPPTLLIPVGKHQPWACCALPSLSLYLRVCVRVCVCVCYPRLSQTPLRGASEHCFS